MDNKVLFIGGIWDEKYEKEILQNSKGGIQSAANVLQNNIIAGLDEVLNEPVTIISSVFVGSFPKLYKKLFIKSKFFKHLEKKRNLDYQVGFCNIPFYKQYSRFFHMKKYIKHVCMDNQMYVIGYSMTYSIIQSLLYAKKINPSCTTCLIVPDLPEYMNLGAEKKTILNILKRINNKTVYKKIKGIDSFVVLTKQMYSCLKVKKPYTVMEGIAPTKSIVKEDSLKDYTIKNIVYTGALDKKYGIMELIDAFVKIKNNNLRLIICGAGDGEQYIKEKALMDSRIKFNGVISNRQAREIQKNAYLLVNPRNSKEEYTKYSFPSKTMEYMTTGRPILMYKLGGIPQEYDDYLYYIETNLYSSLCKILSIPEEELNRKGEAAKEFVFISKNKVEQAKKILKLLNSYNK